MNIFSGKTVEDAVQAGLDKLGVSRDDVEIEVVEEGKKGGLFGIGAVAAQVKLTVKEVGSDGARAVAFLKGLLPLLGAQAEPVLKSEDERVEIELKAESTRGIIGRRGEIIDAIQVLAGAVANTGRDDYKRVVVDCENYREEREETLRRVAEKLAAKAVRIGKKVRLEPMNPYERRIIHAALVGNEEVTTKSEGKEPARFVVIIPKNAKPYEKKDKFRRDGKNKRDYRNSDKKYGERKPYPNRELPTEETPQSSGTSIKRDFSTGSGYKKGGFNGFFGTFLGNAREDEATESTENTEE